MLGVAPRYLGRTNPKRNNDLLAAAPREGVQEQLLRAQYNSPTVSSFF